MHGQWARIHAGIHIRALFFLFFSKRLDLQTLGSQPVIIMPKNLPHHSHERVANRPRVLGNGSQVPNLNGRSLMTPRKKM